MAELNERAELLERYSRAHQKLIATLVQCPRVMWSFKPGPDQWSILEVINHLADSELHGYIRGRRIIAEPGSAVIAYDQDRWANALDYSEQNADDALELFRLARKTTIALLRRLPDDAWSRTMEHPESGTVSLSRWLEIFVRHAEVHIEQIQRIFRIWQAQLGPGSQPAPPAVAQVAQQQQQ